MTLTPSWEANINIKIVLRILFCDALITPSVILMKWHRIVEGVLIGELAYVRARARACVCVCVCV
jgi:hypothetical protein